MVLAQHEAHGERAVLSQLRGTPLVDHCYQCVFQTLQDCFHPVRRRQSPITWAQTARVALRARPKMVLSATINYLNLPIHDYLLQYYTIYTERAVSIPT